MGGAHDGAYRLPLAGSGLLREHKLAREAIQNSVDARRKDDVVRVRFSLERVGKERLEAIGKDLQLSDPGGPIKRSQYAQIDSDGASQGILFIDDFGTLGLTGPSTATNTGDLESRYYRLLLGFGVADDSEESRGGSFGFGKSTYWEASGVNTVAFYSVFEPSEATRGKHARLIVSGLYNTHDYLEDTYTGRAWFGNRETDSFCGPLVDDDAHRMARRLGFEVRQPGNWGTSVMILGCDLDVNRIREGIENHWWPRIVDGQLSIQLVENNEVVKPPDPKSSKALASYIRAYQIAQAQSAVNDEDAVARSFSKSKGREVGWCAIVPADRDDYPPEDERPHDMKPMYPDINEVALIRSPRMVVTYHELRTGPDVVGVYVADNEIDPVLKLAEPPDHTRWAEDSPRLTNQQDKTFVKGIVGRIRRVADELRARLRGDAEDAVGTPGAMEEYLGRLFSVRRGGVTPPPPPPPASNVVVRSDYRIEERGGSFAVAGRATVAAHPRYVGPDFDCVASLRVEALQNDTRTVDEEVGARILQVVGQENSDLQSHELSPHSRRLRIGTEKYAEIRFESDQVDAFTLCQVVVDTVEIR